MFKKVLAAVVASVVAGQAAAVTVYDDGTNKFTLGGHVGIRYQHENGNDGVGNLTGKGDASRINFMFESKLNEDVTAFARGEWGFDVTEHDSSTSFFNNRLGFAGVKGSFGSFSAGKQWSSYSKVALWTDAMATQGGEASGMYGSHGHYNGTARANEALQYNISVQGLNVSAQYQVGSGTKSSNAVAGKTRTREHGYGVAISYDLPVGLSMGVAYNQTKFVEADQKDAKALVVAAKYDQGPIYLAASFSETKNHATIKNSATDAAALGTMEKAHGYEVYGSYQLNEAIKLGAGFNTLRDKSNKAEFKDTKLEYYPVEMTYRTGPFQVSGSYVFEKSRRNGKKVGNRAVAQVRYYF